MIFIAGRWAIAFFARAFPLRFGMIRSVIIRFGGFLFSWRKDRASSPSKALWTSYPRDKRQLAAKWQTSLSSSTTRTDSFPDRFSMTGSGREEAVFTAVWQMGQ